VQRAWARFLIDPRAAIYGAIKSGRLPACKLIGGSYAIYPGELLRAFPLLAQQAKANAPKPTSGALTFPRLGREPTATHDCESRKLRAPSERRQSLACSQSGAADVAREAGDAV
jgi:hypothetical protein